MHRQPGPARRRLMRSLQLAPPVAQCQQLRLRLRGVPLRPARLLAQLRAHLRKGPEP